LAAWLSEYHSFLAPQTQETVQDGTLPLFRAQRSGHLNWPLPLLHLQVFEAVPSDIFQWGGFPNIRAFTVQMEVSGLQRI